jgi:ATP-dependent DNA ligase
MYDPLMSQTDMAPGRLDARTAAARWRPQMFSERGASQVVDALVEPLWTGLRAIALIDGSTVEIRDLDGDPVEEFPEVVDQLAAASLAQSLVIDGYLTHQPLQPLNVLARRDAIQEQRGSAPTMRQLWFGSLGGRARRERMQPVDEIGRDPLPVDDDVAFVAVDLLWIDDEPLLDVPLLERKRVLESVLAESHLIRRGMYVRPPAETWLGSWRAMGFSRLAYKAANSRYTPGERNRSWALADLPSR